MTRGNVRRALPAALLGLALAACSDATGPSADAESQGDTRLIVGRAPAGGGGLAAAVRSRDAVGGGPGTAASVAGRTGAQIDFGQVARLELDVERVEAHRAGGPWESFDIEPVTLDLAAIAPGEGRVLAAADLPEGDYTMVRLFLSDARIVFGEDVVVGPRTFAATDEGGAEVVHALEIPSADQTGLKVPTGRFSVDAEGGTAALVFEPEQTLATVVATGSGRVMMSPVLREADEQEERALEESAEEDDDVGEDESDGEGDDDADASASGSVAVYLGGSRSGGASVAASWAVRDVVIQADGQSGNVTSEDVGSLVLFVSRVEAVAKTGEGAGWVEIPLAGEGDEVTEAEGCLADGEGLRLDLMAEDGAEVRVAGGELPVGDYRNLRLGVSVACITFTEDLSVGQFEYAAGDTYELRVPSGEIEVPTSHFRVTAEDEEPVLLLFDRSSISSLQATGRGPQLAPVLFEAEAEAEETVDPDAGGLVSTR